MSVSIFLRWQALGQLMTMFALLGGVFYLSILYDAPSRNPAVSCEVYVCAGGGGTNYSRLDVRRHSEEVQHENLTTHSYPPSKLINGVLLSPILSALENSVEHA